MDIQIKVSIDNEEVILEGTDAENLIDLQRSMKQDQDDSEELAANKATMRQAVYEKLGLTTEEIAALQ